MASETIADYCLALSLTVVHLKIMRKADCVASVEPLLPRLVQAVSLYLDADTAIIETEWFYCVGCGWR
jgi:hypothetical protein